MSESKYEIILYWDKRDQLYVAEVPDLPGCLAHGQTRAAALASAESAILAWISSAKADGVPVPEPVSRVTA